MSMTVTNILQDKNKSWEQKALEIQKEYDKLLLEISWMRMKMSRAEARVALSLWEDNP